MKQFVGTHSNMHYENQKCLRVYSNSSTTLHLPSSHSTNDTSSQDTLCPLCYTEPETNQHIMLCTSRTIQYQTHFCKNTQKSLKLSDEESEKVLTDVFQSILTTPSGLLTQHTFTDQKDIGWEKGLSGFLTKEWLKIAPSITTKRKPTEVMGHIIYNLWETWVYAWNHRNDLFKNEDRYLHITQSRQREIDLRIIYRCKPWMSKRLQKQLHESVQTHLQRSAESIDSWLQLYKSVMYESVKNNKRNYLENYRTRTLTNNRIKK